MTHPKVTKPPSHSTMARRVSPTRTMARPMSTNSVETEPPAYSELYTRDDSKLDRLVVSRKVETSEILLIPVFRFVMGWAPWYTQPPWRPWTGTWRRWRRLRCMWTTVCPDSSRKYPT